MRNSFYWPNLNRSKFCKQCDESNPMVFWRSLKPVSVLSTRLSLLYHDDPWPENPRCFLFSPGCSVFGVGQQVLLWWNLLGPTIADQIQICVGTPMIWVGELFCIFCCALPLLLVLYVLRWVFLKVVAHPERIVRPETRGLWVHWYSFVRHNHHNHLASPSIDPRFHSVVPMIHFKLGIWILNKY